MIKTVAIKGKLTLRCGGCHGGHNSGYGGHDGGDNERLQRGGSHRGSAVLVVGTVLQPVAPLLQRQAQFAGGADPGSVSARLAYALACRLWY
jgi:hypothetical protein